MTTHYAIIRCVAMKQDGKPISPCSTCARFVHALPYQHKKSPLWTMPPAFWNGERYVCEHHMEIKNGQ